MPPEREQLLKVLELLEPQDRQLLMLRFGLTGDESNPKSINQLAVIYNRSLEEMRTELRRVEHLAQCKLRKM